MRESIALIQAAGAAPHAVAIALDLSGKSHRKRARCSTSAVQYVTQQLGLQVCAIALERLAAVSGPEQQQRARPPASSGAQLLKTITGLFLAYRKDATAEDIKLRLHTLFSLGLAGLACLGGIATAQDIYTCVDAKGRTITADQPCGVH